MNRLELYNEILNIVIIQKDKYVAVCCFETACVFRELEKFLLECESVDKFIEYIKKLSYNRNNIYKRECLSIYEKILKNVRKVKLEKLEKLYQKTLLYSV